MSTPETDRRAGYSECAARGCPQRAHFGMTIASSIPIAFVRV